MKRNRKKYTREFKIEAVRLMTDGGVSIAQASRDLGVDANVLGRWKKELSEDSKHAFPGKGNLKPEDEEVRRLRARSCPSTAGARYFKKSRGVLCQGIELRYQFIAEHLKIFEVRMMCRVLEVSRAGFYRWRKRPDSQRSMENRKLVKEIEAIHRESRGVYGSPRIHAHLCRQARYGKNRIARLMRLHGIRSIQKRKFRVTTDSRHALPVAKNVLDRKFSAREPNKRWNVDITYIPTQEGWLYLAVVMDLYSRKIVGWAMDRRITKDLVRKALQMALESRNPDHGLLHHSDRGSQYASGEYQKLLRSKGMIGSMSRKGNCWDNAVVESFFSALKTELVHHRQFESRRRAQLEIFDYIEVFYNRQRLHSALGYQSPEEFEKLRDAA